MALPTEAEWAIRQVQVGNALYLKYEKSDDPGDLDEAIQWHSKGAAAVTSNKTDRWAALSNFATSLTRRGTARDLEMADEVLTRVQRGRLPAAHLASLHMARGHVREKRYRQSRQSPMQREEDLRIGVDAYRQASGPLGHLNPRAGIIAARRWCAWALDRRETGEAIESGKQGLELVARALRSIDGRHDKESWLREAQGLASNLAYAWAVRGDAAEAALAVEQGRGVLLASAMRDNALLERLDESPSAAVATDYRLAQARLGAVEANSELIESSPSRPSDTELARQTLSRVTEQIQALEGFETFQTQPSRDELLGSIRQEAKDATLVYIVAAGPGGAIVLLASNGEDRILLAPHLNRSEVLDQVNKYLKAYRERRVSQSRWLQQLSATTVWLWTNVMGPILATQGDRASSVPTRLVLVPTGYLALLPVHCATSPADVGTNSLRRYAIDECSIRYAPNAWVLTSSRSRKQVTDSILAVTDPQPVDAPRLPGSIAEVQAVTAHFSNALVLSGADANRTRILGELSAHNVLHFSCHGTAARNPLDAGVLTAGNEWLTARDLLKHRLPNATLVVLSACETAFPGLRLVDEVVSLSSSFLQAGAIGVAGTLWSVDDLSTMILATRFYELWRQEGLEPAEALRQAQRWLRDLTVEGCRSVHPEIAFAANLEPTDRPYEHPYWWGGFAYHGR